MEFQHQDITEQIIGAAFEVYGVLGSNTGQQLYAIADTGNC
jgi:hypothetical protein